MIVFFKSLKSFEIIQHGESTQYVLKLEPFGLPLTFHPFDLFDFNSSCFPWASEWLYVVKWFPIYHLFI